MRLIDTHTHLDFPDFDADRTDVLARSRELGVERLVILGVHQANWQRVWQLVEGDKNLYAALGLHPIYLAEHQPHHLQELREWLQCLEGHPQLCAVGEIGLDYFIETLDRQQQQTWFEAQLQLAAEFELPALIHVRRSHAKVIATLKRIGLQRGGIIHAFSGSYEEAREYIKLGFKLGLGGAPTWPQALRMHRVLPQLPLDAIVLETDSPDMPPAMYPQQRNSPEHLPDICHALALHFKLDAEQLASITSANAAALFGWSS